MANTFKVLNWSAAAAAASNLYTVPAATTTIVLQLQAANVGSGTHPVSATVKDTTAANTEFIAKALSGWLLGNRLWKPPTCSMYSVTELLR